MKRLYHVRKVRSIDFSVFDYFSIGFWNYTDRVLFFVFPFLLCNRVVNWYGSKQKFQHCITLSSTRYSQHATFQKTKLCLNIDRFWVYIVRLQKVSLYDSGISPVIIKSCDLGNIHNVKSHIWPWPLTLNLDIEITPKL